MLACLHQFTQQFQLEPYFTLIPLCSPLIVLNPDLPFHKIILLPVKTELQEVHASFNVGLLFWVPDYITCLCSGFQTSHLTLFWSWAALIGREQHWYWPLIGQLVSVHTVSVWQLSNKETLNYSDVMRTQDKYWMWNCNQWGNNERLVHWLNDCPMYYA